MTKEYKPDCWTCIYMEANGECTAEIPGGTTYAGWSQPCKSYKPLHNVKIEESEAEE